MNADRPSSPQLSKHRIEALTDGIYAVAMTLLVIELKLPAHDGISTERELITAVVHLLPQFLAWVISFLVLSLFWVGHHRLFHYVRTVDGPLLTLNIVQLGLIGLFPFSSALAGEFGRALFSQLFYSANMTLLAIVALFVARYIHVHRELCGEQMPAAVYRGARVRMATLIVISGLAVPIAIVVPGFGNVAFSLMAIVMPLSRRMEARRLRLA